MAEELRVRYDKADWSLIRSYVGSWCTYEEGVSGEKYHTAGVLPSSYDSTIIRYDWRCHGKYHRESGKSWSGPEDYDDQYWDLNNVNLEGRLLLW